MLTTSEAAFNASLPSTTDLRAAASLNGDIVSDSESDIPESYVKITSLASEEAKALIYKKRKACVQRAYQFKAKTIAEKRFLSHKISQSIKNIDCFPDLEKQ